jgi:pilus assembly protein Flp/PilA
MQIQIRFPAFAARLQPFECCISEGGSMSALVAGIVHFLRAEDGPAAVEYAVMLALILTVCIATINPLGLAAEAVCQTVCDALEQGA